MVEFLNEDYLTVASELIFPNVQTCCAVIVTSTLNNSLGGYHLTVATTRFEMDYALGKLKAGLGGSIDGVYLIGNVEGRIGVKQAGMAYAQPLKSTLASGLQYKFDIKYYDIGSNNSGVAVRTWRHQTTNQPRFAVADNGSWVSGSSVTPSNGMVKIREKTGTGSGGQTPTIKETAPPSFGVASCVINSEKELPKFYMKSF